MDRFTIKYGVTVEANSFREAETKALDILRKELGEAALKRLRRISDFYGVSRFT